MIAHVRQLSCSITPIVAELSAEHSAHESLTKIANSVHRAANLTRELRAYAGDAPILLEPLDLNLLVRQAAASLSNSTLTRAAIRLQLAPEFPLVGKRESLIEYSR